MLRTQKKYIAFPVTAISIVLALFIYLTGCGENVIDKSVELDYIKITPPSAEMTAGGKLYFAASGVGKKGEALIISPAWDAHDGTIDSCGVYLAPSYKTLDRITAYCDGKIATSLIAVNTKSEAVSIKIYPEITHVSAGAEERFHAVAVNEFGEEVPVSVKWASQFGSISQDGVYRAPIKACHDAVSANTVSATGARAFDVDPREPYKIFISPKTISIRSMGAYTFSAKLYDIYNNPVDSEFIRYSAKRGKIGNNGYYQAPLTTGSEEVTVNYDFITDSASVEIIP